jgi:hypothetical protein
MMSRRGLILVAAVVAAVALVVGVVSVAGAGSSTTLATVSAAELLTKMSQANDRPQAVSGRISWRNRLFGDFEVPSDLAQMPAHSPLTSGGEGRLWASEEGVRIESQGGGGDQVAVASKASRTAWMYESATNTARRYVMTTASGDAPRPSPSAAATLTPSAVSSSLRRLAPYAAVEVAGQATVAGREAYVLRMTPLAEDTAMGSVEALVDGETMMPLRVEVFAKSGGEAVLEFGFDSVSYEAIDASLYEFTVPDGATVTTEEIDSAETRAAAEEERGRAAATHGPAKPENAEREKLARRALLTIDQAQSLVAYELARARGYDARPFRWAYVLDEGVPRTATGKPLFGMAGMDEPQTSGPSTVLLYGSGFGAITLAQTKTTPELSKQLEQLPVALVESTTANGSAVHSLTTPLGGVLIWQQGDSTLIAGGLVTKADLEAFVQTVR